MLNLEEKCGAGFGILQQSHGQIVLAGPVAGVCDIKGLGSTPHDMGLVFRQSKIRQAVIPPAQFLLPAVMGNMDTDFLISGGVSSQFPAQT